jgi:predicted nucleic acid-binding protein
MTVERLQFVDTNILVYAHDVTAGKKNAAAKALLLDLWQTKNGCISVQVLQEFYVTVTQKIKTPLGDEEASQIISDLSAWEVNIPSVADVLSAIQIRHKHQVSFWDAMIIQCAQAMGCKTLWTEDLSPRLYDDVQVINPFL